MCPSDPTGIMVALIQHIPHMIQNLKKILSLHGLKVLAYPVMLGICIYYFFINIMIIRTEPSPNLIYPGTPFEAFKDPLKEIPKVGYLTNKDMSEESNDGLFLMAQFELAPTILKLNEVDPKYNILDYSAPVYFLLSFKKLHAIPIRTSTYGMTLTERQL